MLVLSAFITPQPIELAQQREGIGTNVRPSLLDFVNTLLEEQGSTSIQSSSVKAFGVGY